MLDTTDAFAKLETSKDAANYFDRKDVELPLLETRESNRYLCASERLNAN